MNNKPLVSGITIFLNAERFIGEAIESVIAQTYENWELVLVDDGSSDKSTAIAKRYAQLYPERIYYIEHEGHHNLGKSASRNLGVRYSKGEYIAFLDADDIWLPHKLEQQVPILEAHPKAGLMYGRTQYWYSWRKNPEPLHPDVLTKPIPIDVNRLVEPATMPLLFFLQDQDIYPCTCSVLVRRWVFETVGGFEETFRVFNEDMAFYSKVFLKKIPAFISTECWDRYRQHENSSWAIEKNQAFYFPPWRPHPAWLNYMYWLESYMLEREIDEIEISKALERNLWPSRHPTFSTVVWNIFLRPVLLAISIAISILRPILPAHFRHWLWGSAQKSIALVHSCIKLQISKSIVK